MLDVFIEGAIKTDEFQALLRTIGAVPPERGTDNSDTPDAGHLYGHDATLATLASRLQPHTAVLH